MNIVYPQPGIRLRQPSGASLAPLLDAATMRVAVGEALSCRVRAVSVDRVHFPKSRPVQIHYRYWTDHRRAAAALIGQWVGEDACAHCAREVRRIARANLTGGPVLGEESVVAVDDLGIALRRPGFDARLPGLRLLHDNGFATDFLTRLFGVPAQNASASVELKAHRLGRRAVLFARLNPQRGSSRECYIRLRPVTHDGGQAAFETHRRIHAAARKGAALQIPQTLHFDDRLGAAVISPMPGRQPYLASRDDMALAANALSEWRRLEGPHDDVWTAIDEIMILKAWADRIRTYRERMAGAFGSALERVSADLYCLPAVRPVLGHRDFHDGQLLIDGERCGLMDFDTSVKAPPALDAGNFIAHMRLHALRTGEDTGPAEAVFRAAECGNPGLTGRHLDAWTKAALLRLAAIYAFTDERRGVVSALMAAAR